MRKTATGLSLTAAALGAGIAGAAPASAGGIGDFLSPAFGVTCANLHNGARAQGATTQGTGAANGNLAELPLGSALNQCGGADLLPQSNESLGHLRSKFQTLTQMYTGQASEEFTTVRKEWNSAANSLNGALSRIATSSALS